MCIARRPAPVGGGPPFRASCGSRCGRRRPPCAGRLLPGPRMPHSRHTGPVCRGRGGGATSHCGGPPWRGGARLPDELVCSEGPRGWTPSPRPLLPSAPAPGGRPAGPSGGTPPRPSLRPAPGRRGLGQRQAVRLSVSCRPCHAREASRCRGRNVANGPKVTPKRFDQRLGPGLLPSPLDLVDRQECTRFTFRRVRPGSRGPWPGLGPARRVRPPSPRVGPPGLRESVGGAEPHPSRGPARLLPVYCGRCVSGERVSRQLLPRALGRGGPSPWRLSPRLCPPARTSPESPSMGLRPRWPA